MRGAGIPYEFVIILLFPMNPFMATGRYSSQKGREAENTIDSAKTAQKECVIDFVFLFTITIYA